MSFQQYPFKGGIPSGNTAARPGSPVIGDTYYNGQLEILEIYNGTTWVAVSAPPATPTITSVTDVGTGLAYTTGGTFTVVLAAGSGGSTASQFNVSTTTGGFSASSSGATVSLTGLTPATSFVVVANAQNNFGTTVNSNPFSAVTATTAPQAPTIGTATAGPESATLTFTAGSNGGKSITNYQYSTDNITYTAFSPAQTSSPLTISGLTAGTPVTFRIKAVNDNGVSPQSSASNSVTPISSTVSNVDYLVVAGGGAGASKAVSSVASGGGGAGGLRSTVTATGGGGTLETALTLNVGTTYTVTVGGGATGAAGTSAENGVLAASGTNSSISGTGLTTITSTGGGGAAGGQHTQVNNASNGGSGGGGGAGDAPAQGAGSGTSGQGYAGGTGTPSGSNTVRSGGGGGGAGAAGGNGGSGNNGSGGNGVAVSITGSSVTYAGGGGAACGDSSGTKAGSGGSGGGGAGSVSTGAHAGSGDANSGSGGGGFSGSVANNGGSGGSGVVIIRALQAAASTTGSPTYTTSGSYHIYKFTGSGSITY
jgi:hypothetical protein